jgi:enoyl-CoA hydratase/carnithine racemase
MPQHVAVVHFQNGKSNALSKAFIDDLNKTLDGLENDDQVHCVVLTGNDCFFSAGADLKELSQVTANGFQNVDFIEPWQRLSFFKKPCIAAVSGYALGGGLELALMADIIIAGETAVFGMPEVSLDLLPGGGGTQRLSRQIGHNQALELCLTGKTISAHEARQLGIVQHVAPSPVKDAIAMAERISQFNPYVTQAIKKSIQEGNKVSFEEGMVLERKLFHTLLQVGNYQVKIENFLNKKGSSS